MHRRQWVYGGSGQDQIGGVDVGGVDVVREVDDDRGRGRWEVESCATGLDRTGDRHERRADNAEEAADWNAARAVELEGTDIARSVAGQLEAGAGDLDLGVAKEVGGDGGGF